MNQKKIIFNILSFIFIAISLLLFLKIDYRLVNDLGCCSDESDYYMHAETIVEDFDFDYSNQLYGHEEDRYYKNNKSAPIGFLGSGILFSPFLLLGNFLDYIFNLWTNEPLSSITNFKILTYSFGSVFYLFISINLIIYSLQILNVKFSKIHIYIIFLGNGITYYAFERYGMSHVPEVLGSSIIIFLSVKYYSANKNQNFISIILPIFLLISYSIKWVNYYILILPLLIKLIFFKNKQIYKPLHKNILFIFSLIFSSSLFFISTYFIYGKFTINPSYVYTKSDLESNVKLESLFSITENVIETLLSYLKNFLIILFSEEFGIFWFSPIIFFVLVFLIYEFLKNIRLRDKNFTSYLAFLVFMQVIFIHILWESPGSSYGYRYLLNLIPLCVMLYFYKYKKNIYIHKLLITLSVFALFSTIFFETTEMTQLSTVPVINSFGINSSFTQPLYLRGYLMSIFEIESYLKIFTTSYLGLSVLKVLTYVFGKENLLTIFEVYNLPIGNTKFLTLLDNVELIPIFYFVVLFLFIFFVIRLSLKTLKN